MKKILILGALIAAGTLAGCGPRDEASAPDPVDTTADSPPADAVDPGVEATADGSTGAQALPPPGGTTSPTAPPAPVPAPCEGLAGADLEACLSREEGVERNRPASEPTIPADAP